MSEEIEKLSVALALDAGSFSKQMSAINKQIKNSERDFKSASKGVEDFENTFVGLDAKIQKTSNQLDLYNLKLNKQQQEYDKLSSKLENQKSKLQELEDTVGKGSKEWEKQAQLVQRNSEKLDKLASDIKNTQSNINTLSSELESSKKAFEELGNKTQTLDEKLEAIEQQSTLTQSQFNKLSSEVTGVGQFFLNLSNDINRLSNEIQTNQQKIKLYEDEIRKLGNELDNNKQDHQQLASEIKSVESQLSQAKNIYGENSREAQQLGQKLLALKDDYNKLETEIENNKSEINQYQTELNNTQAELNNLSNELKKLPFDELGGKLDDASSKLSGFSLAMGGIVGASISAGGEASNALGQIKGALGETASESEKTLESIKDLSQDGFNFDAALEAMILVKQTMSDLLSPQEIENFTGDVIALSNTFGVDFNEVIKTTSTMMRNFGIDGENALDIIAYGFQNGLNASDDWNDTLWEYSNQFSSLGFTAEDTLSIISNGMKEGTFNTDKLADMIKESNIRLKEMGDNQIEAVKKLGLSATTVQDNISKGGETAAKQMIEVAKKIMEVKDPVEQNSIAVELMGTMFEDLGINGVKALADLRQENINVKGTIDGVRQSFEETFGAKISAVIADLKEPLIELGESMIPIVENGADLISEFSEWFSSLDEGTITSIGNFVLIGAAIAPILSTIGNLIVVAGNLTTIFGGLTGASTGLSGAMAILSGPVGIGLAVAALAGLMVSVGDNESAILGLQEKFGVLGFAIGATCEFISGVSQMAFGGLLIAIQTIGEAIVALVSGRWKDIPDIIKQGGYQMVLNNEEAMQKMLLTTTIGMDNLRNASSEQLQGTVQAMDTIMSAIPSIVDGKYRTASQNLGNQLAKMDAQQINILQGMNDTTRMMFEGIQQGMTVDKASKRVEQNLKQMAAAGKIDAETMEKDVTKALEQMKQQMDTKTKEGSKAVDTNTKDASNKANTNSSQMASTYTQNVNKMVTGANKELSRVPQDVDTQMAKAGQATKQHASDMYNGVTTSFSKMASNSKQSSSDMYNGTTTSSSKMSSSAKQHASDMYNGVTTSTSRMANAAIADWGRIRSAYAIPVRGEIIITTTKKTVHETVTKNSGGRSTENYNEYIDLPDHINIRKYDLSGSYYSPDSNVSNVIKTVTQSNFNFSRLEKKLDIISNKIEKIKSINQENKIVINSSEPLSPYQIVRQARKELEELGREL